MNRPDRGTVLVEGLYQGPASRWDPDPEALRRALRLGGVPPGFLVLECEGGQRLLEPGPGSWRRAEFAADPGESLALALRSLLEEELGGTPPEWACTLRTIEFFPAQRRETLLQVDAAGVRTLAQESLWQPVPVPPLWERLLVQWKLILPVLLALALLAFAGREQVLAPLRNFSELLGLDFLSGAEADPGDFSPWVAMELERRPAGGLQLRLRPLTTFPGPAEFAALDRESSAARRGALAALRDGDGLLLLISRREGVLRSQALDLAPLREGREVVVELSAADLPPRLAVVRLVAP